MHTVTKDHNFCCPSLHEIFPTDAGQLSDRLKFLAGKNKILQDRRLVCYQITISFCQKSQDIFQILKFSAGQNENLPVLSDSPAVFAKTAVPIFARVMALLNVVLRLSGLWIAEKGGFVVHSVSVSINHKMSELLLLTLVLGYALPLQTV